MEREEAQYSPALRRAYIGNITKVPDIPAARQAAHHDRSETAYRRIVTRSNIGELPIAAQKCWDSTTPEQQKKACGAQRKSCAISEFMLEHADVS